MIYLWHLVLFSNHLVAFMVTELHIVFFYLSLNIYWGCQVCIYIEKEISNTLLKNDQTLKKMSQKYEGRPLSEVSWYC